MMAMNASRPAQELLDPIILNRFGRVSDPCPDAAGARILYGVTYYSIEENTGKRKLFVIDVDGKNKKDLGSSPYNESHARWYKDNRILFLRDGQLWGMDQNGENRRQLSRIPGGILEFSLSPAQDKILYTAKVKYATVPTDRYPELDKATGRIINDLMYRHWDEFVEEIPHCFVSPFSGESLEAGTDLLEGTPYECPALPFSGIEQLSWDPRGDRIAYACRKSTGREYALSTNTDIYLRNLLTGEEENLSEGMPGYDTRPLFSPCGRYIVWCSMERAGYEADKDRLMLYDFADKSLRDLTAAFDYNVESVCWRADSRGLYFTSCVQGLCPVFAIDLDSGEIRQITHSLNDYRGVQCAGDKLIATYCSMAMPDEVVSIDPRDGDIRNVSCENKALLDRLCMGKMEQRRITTVDGKQMHTWIVYPPHFDPSKKYPALLYCLGGPQGTCSQSWSYRWNPQLMAANGYIVIMPNRRGTTAFGREWCEQISGDYAGLNIQDYLSATDALKKEPYVDGAHMGAVGASYGGYSVYYLAGNHEGRFAAFIAHAGIFNTEHMYMETEEMWFPNWDNGGAPWDDNPTALRHYAHSPHKFVKKWDTPILITHGEKDYRVPVDQAMAAFNAARLLDVPAEMLLFPDENHWILKPQNNILWNKVFFEFLDKYLK